MIIINHKVNSVEKLKQLPTNTGVEIDLRPDGNRIILHHDPFVHGEDFEEWITHYRHALLVLNIKSEGIEERVLEIVERHGIKEYFLLDQSQPFLIKYARQGFRKTAVRFSEMEAIEMALNFAGKVDWVFIDNTTHLPTENGAFEQLKKHFKICIVGPELLGRKGELAVTKEIARRYDVDAVLTDNLAGWTMDHSVVQHTETDSRTHHREQ